ncbi:MAG TPA: ABC transporter ATP-binding protein [Jatrophihabitantaceae bacterium]|jgi:molybdate transport system ATP-binding protein
MSTQLDTEPDAGLDGGLDASVEVARGSFRLELDIQAGPGEIVGVLGPNGAGKTTLLRTLAGLLPLSGGYVRLSGAVLDDPATGVYLDPPRRRIGVVFQDYRLFPRMRVLDNVAFGPRSRGVGRAAARRTAQQWLDRLDIGQLARRRPGQLSGGQAQRVALARALAAEPRLLLLDEPLAALDARTRATVQGELREHLTGFAGPTLLVTHDPLEALLLADRIVVLESGRIVQQGSPHDIAARPVTDYVATLVGVNLYAGVAAGGRVELDGGGTIVIGDTALTGRTLVAVRPSAITVYTSRPDPGSARNLWPGRIDALAPLGDRIRLSVSGSPGALVDVTPPAVADLDLARGREVWLATKATEVDAYPDQP